VKDDRLYLHHMLERCRRIAHFIGPGKERFLASEELQDAVIRNIEVIGEAAKRVSPESRARLTCTVPRVPILLRRKSTGPHPNTWIHRLYSSCSPTNSQEAEMRSSARAHAPDDW
jgi:hypothetical protein